MYSLPVFKVIGERPKGLIERALSVFADVRAGEGITTLLLTLNVFLLLAGYSVMKPARDGLILTEGGAEARLLFGGGAGRAPDGCRAVLRLARHARRPHQADRDRDDILRGDAGRLLRRRHGRAARRASRSTSGSDCSTCSSCRSSGSSRTISSPKGRDAGCFRLIGVGQSLGAWVGAAAVAPLVRAAELHAVHADAPRRGRAGDGAGHDADGQLARDDQARDREGHDAGT